MYPSCGKKRRLAKNQGKTTDGPSRQGPGGRGDNVLTVRRSPAADGGRTDDFHPLARDGRTSPLDSPECAQANRGSGGVRGGDRAIDRDTRISCTVTSTTMITVDHLSPAAGKSGLPTFDAIDKWLRSGDIAGLWLGSQERCVDSDGLHSPHFFSLYIYDMDESAILVSSML